MESKVERFLYRYCKLLLMSFVFNLIAESQCSSGGFYADNGLQQTVRFKPLGKREQKQLQSEILHLLGMDHRPKPKHHDMHASAHQYLWDLYKEVTSNESISTDDFGELQSSSKLGNSDFIVSFMNKMKQQFPHLRHERDRRFYFDLSEISLEEEIIKAELRIYRNQSQYFKKNSDRLTLSLYAVVEDASNENAMELIEEIPISNDKSGWIVLNVTRPIMNWIVFPWSNLGLFMKIRSQETSEHIKPRDIGITGSKGPEEYQPFLVSYFKSSSRTRVRRRRATKKSMESYHDPTSYNPYSGHFSRAPSKRSCQKLNLYVSFRELGWEDWIIAPDGYGAFYCQGFCSFPLNSHMNATNHAIVQTLVHLMDPSRVPKPCCAPTSLSAITVLYFDDNSNVILKKYKNMIVRSCGCH